MKTINQHFIDNLPKDVLEKAIKNTTKEGVKFGNLKDEHERFESALICAFTWQKSPEGWDYWNSIFKTYPKK